MAVGVYAALTAVRHRWQASSHIYGYPHFCNTVFDACLACFHLSGVWVATLRLDENRARRP
ncbi:hypothetical protein F7R06_30260, partial [Pseudomonas moorei]